VFHDRTPDNLASLAVGLEFFLRYAEEAGAITADESEQYWRQGWQALRRVAARQSEHQLGEEHTQRFLHLLTGVLASGQGHLADASDGNAPPDAGHWGWREVEIGTGENFRREWRPHGSCVGWIEGENLLLQPEAVFASVQRLAKDQGTAFSITQRTLFKRLAEKGLLASREPTQDRLNVRWTIAGERKRVIHLHAASLTIETGPIGPNGPPSHSQARERTERPDRSSAVSDETGPENWSRTEHLTLEDPFDSLTGPVGPVLQAEVACERAEREEIEL